MVPDIKYMCVCIYIYICIYMKGMGVSVRTEKRRQKGMEVLEGGDDPVVCKVSKKSNVTR